MKLYLLLVLFVGVLFTSACHALPKNKPTACTLDYADFWKLDYFKVSTQWDKKQLADLQALVHQTADSTSIESLYYLLPPILQQLKWMESTCGKNIDKTNKKALQALYASIREVPKSAPIPVLEADFYQIVADNQLLAHTHLTFDDGPFFGSAYTLSGIEIPYARLVLEDLGYLDLIYFNDHTVLCHRNQDDEVVWARDMRGIDNQALELTPVADAFHKNSLAYEIHFSTSTEKLRLFLRHDGSFMYYFHSW